MTLSPPGRRVRRLHLRAAVEEDASRASTLLADALHTASIPAADQGRLVVIRRLALGRISTHVSSASLALQIERVARDAMAEAVSWDVPAGREANAVFFADRGDAIVALARLHARGAAADEWFWPAVVTGWRTDRLQAERWALLVDAAHRLPQGAIVAARVVSEAMASGAEDVLLSSVDAVDCVEWLRLHGWSNLDAESVASPVMPPALLRRLAILARPERRAGGRRVTDDRLVWLGTLVALKENPGRAADPLLAARVARALADAVDAAMPELVESRAPRPELAATYTSESHPDAPRRADAASSQSPEVPHIAAREIPHVESDAGDGYAAQRSAGHAPGREQDATAGAARRAPHLDASEVGSDPALLPPPLEPFRVVSGDFSPYAGLLFLVPILHRLGFAGYLASHPALVDAEFPARLLWTIGERVGLTRDDPHALAIPPPEPNAFDVAACRSLELPVTVRDLLSTPVPRVALDSPFVAWLTAVRRWSRRHARLGLVTLVRRRARLEISPTHVDVCFALSSLDVRVRRVALDVDPGWVPWLGRVVRFHYEGDDSRRR